mmetsp:Transcript_46457/g.108186  ORF Transcript_46457/g.108186 Transcript_46457/m.108186 type:complete len:591 (-) Transcript_46457:108-1880(-)
MAATQEEVVAKKAKPEATVAAPALARSRASKIFLRPDAKLLSLFMVYFTVFVDFLGVALLVPIIPFLVGTVESDDGFSRSDMGGLEPGAASALIMFTFNGAQLVSTIIFGPASDRYGRRPMLLASLIGGAIGYALQGVAILLGNFYLLLAARAFTGLFGGTRPVAIAYIADAAEPHERAKLLGLLALAVMFAMQFGPVLGGSLGLLSLQLPCYVAAAVSGIGALLVSSLVKEARQPGSAAAGGPGTQAKNGDRSAFLLNLVLSFFAGIWVMSHVMGMALLLPSKFDFDPNKVGLTSLGDGVAILLANPLYMWAIRRVRLPTVCAAGSALMIFSGICPYVEVAPLLVFRYIAGFGTSLLLPAVSAIVGLIAPEQKRGKWSGATMASQNFGRTVSPIIIGLTFDVDYHLPFLISAGIAVAAMVTSLVLIPCIGMPAPAPEKGAQDETAIEESKAEESYPTSDAFQSELSAKAEVLIEKLHERRARLKKRLQLLENGEDDHYELPMATDEKRAQSKIELGDWFTGTLEGRGYSNWPEYLDGVKLILCNSFPPLRADSAIDKIVDLLAVLEGHIRMAEGSRLFNGAEDLVHGIV